MSIYCLCRLRGQPIRQQGDAIPARPNYEVFDNGEAGARPRFGLVLMKPMTVLENGSQQFIDDADGTPPRRHYPNADTYECAVCGARVARDG